MLLALLALVTLAWTSIGCGSDDSATDASTGTTGAGKAASAGQKISVVIPDPVGAYYQMACGARLEGQRLGFDIGSPQAPKTFNNVADVTQVLRATLATRPDGVLYAAPDAVASGVPLKQAVADGVSVGLLLTRLDDSSLYSSIAGLDLVQAGEEGGKLLAKQIGGEGEVAVVSMLPDNPNTKDRIAGFKRAMESQPNIKVVTILYSSTDINKIASDSAALLQRYPNLKGIYTTNDLAASGAAQALRTAGKAGDVKLITFDLNDAGVKLMKEGTVTGTIAGPVREVGAVAMRQLAAKLEGKPFNEEEQLSSYPVEADQINAPKVKAAYYSREC